MLLPFRYCFISILYLYGWELLWNFLYFKFPTSLTVNTLNQGYFPPPPLFILYGHQYVDLHVL